MLKSPTYFQVGSRANLGPVIIAKNMDNSGIHSHGDPMSLSENAVMSYQPNDELNTLIVARNQAEKQLGNLNNVLGFGQGQTPEGKDAIVVFVKSKETLLQIPDQISGVPIIGEVTGEIWAQ